MSVCSIEMSKYAIVQVLAPILRNCTLVNNGIVVTFFLNVTSLPYNKVTQNKIIAMVVNKKFFLKISNNWKSYLKMGKS